MKKVMLRNLSAVIVLLSTALGSGVPHPMLGSLPTSSVALASRATPSQPAAACGGLFPVVGDASVDPDNPSPYGGGLSLPLYKGEGEREVRPLLLFNLAGDVPSNAGMFQAWLELPIHESAEPYPYQVDVYTLQAEFDEHTVAWWNQPALGEKFASLTSTLDEDVLRIDVTAMLVSWLHADLPQALALLPGSPVDLSFKSKDSGDGPRLFIDCITLEERIPPDRTLRDLQQALAIQQLQAASAVPLELKLGLGGSLRFAHFDLAIPAEAGEDRLEQAQWFLDEYRGLFRLDEPRTEMQLVRRSENGDSLFFRQRVNGIPLFPSETAVHMHADSLIGVAGAYLPDISSLDVPLLSASVAERLALAAAGGGYILGVTQLNFVNLGLLGLDDHHTYLAWRVNAAGAQEPGMYYIDAATGKLLLSVPHLVESYDLELSTGNQDGPYIIPPCWDGWGITADDQWADENGQHSDFPDPPPNPDAEGMAAFAHIKAVYDFYHDTFGRDSFDNHGAQIRAYVHVGNPWRAAAWAVSCDILQFGDDFVANDTVAHEFTHAVNRRTANLVSYYQSGALSESFSDIFAAFVDVQDWIIGEDDWDGGRRDMQDPTSFGFPDRMSDFWNIDLDHGGVHANAGIHNKAAYLLIQGDTFNGWTVTGIGRQKAAQLFYQVLTWQLPKNAQFVDARDAAVWTAYDFYRYGQHAFTQDDVCQVRNAFAAVELGPGDLDCDLVEDWKDPDDDGDGWPDPHDNCPLAVNGSQADTDTDGNGDACDDDIDGDFWLNDQDLCPYVASAEQLDANANGIGDACEDTDGDGTSNLLDNCVDIRNSDQRDQDTDNLGDVCDPDIDEDGQDNDLDNCPTIANPDQLNKDKDTYGNVCDLCPTKASTDNTDTDSDGRGNPCDPDDDNDSRLDGDDNCPLTPNLDQLDTDQNGVGYACDSNERSGLFNGIPHSGLLQFASIDFPWSIWLPAFSGSAGEYLPPGFVETIHLAVPGLGLRGRVVDSEGLPMATSALAPDGSLQLAFYPHPYAAVSAQEIQSPLFSTLEDYTLAPDQVGYRLELYPREQSELGFVYPFTIQVSTAGPYIYLPLIWR